eukprot:PhF_6_TR36028/c0_g1_i1/m.52226/K15542/PFS2; polyadenylation factor subunit 2
MQQPHRPARRPRDDDEADFRKVSGAKSSDYFCNIITLLQTRPYRNPRHFWSVPPLPSASKDLLPANHILDNPLSAVCTQWINTIYNRIPKVRFTEVGWFPGGRRLLCSNTKGDFSLWNGHSYSKEYQTVAHENVPCHALCVAQVNDLILSGDDYGRIKLWQSNLNLVGVFQAHTSGGKAVKEVVFSPSEEKFATASKDGTAKVWDTNEQKTDTRLEGHGADVNGISWHPTYALIATASSDKQIRLWDPRAAKDRNCVGRIDGHADVVTRVRFNMKNDNRLLSCSKDKTIRLFDLRTLSQTDLFHGHSGDVTSIEWHPQHENLFASTSLDMTLAFWIVNFGESTLAKEGRDMVNKWVAAVPKAHPLPIVGAKWHPLGHVIATTSLDGRLWTRNKPGTEAEVRYSETMDTSYDVATTAEGARRAAR